MILAVDCQNLCYMSFFAFKDLSWEERQTGVIFGFLKQIFKLCWEFNTNRVAFCWDSRKNYRKQIYPLYKANRADLTEEEMNERKILYFQISQLRQSILPRLGFKNIFIATGYEADDILAWIVNRKVGVTIVSSDSDLWQLLDDCVIYDPRKNERITADDIKKMHKVKPKQWIDVKAMVGDTSDNIAGINGIGQKRATQYLRGKLNDKFKKLIESKENKKIIERNKKLITLPLKHRKINIDFDDEVFDVDDWLDVFEEYGLRSFMAKDFMSRLRDIFFVGN